MLFRKFFLIMARTERVILNNIAFLCILAGTTPFSLFNQQASVIFSYVISATVTFPLIIVSNAQNVNPFSLTQPNFRPTIVQRRGTRLPIHAPHHLPNREQNPSKFQGRSANQFLVFGVENHVEA